MSDQEKTKRKSKLKAKSIKIVTHEMKQIVTNSEGEKPQPDTTLGNSVHNAIPWDQGGGGGAGYPKSGTYACKWVLSWFWVVRVPPSVSG